MWTHFISIARRPLALCNEELVFCISVVFRLLLCLYRQTDNPSRPIIHFSMSTKTNLADSSSARIVRLFTRIYTQTNYETH